MDLKYLVIMWTDSDFKNDEEISFLGTYSIFLIEELLTQQNTIDEKPTWFSREPNTNE